MRSYNKTSYQDIETGAWLAWYSPGPWFNIKMSSYQYRKSHCGDKMILRPSYLHNGISYTGNMSSLYWIRALISPLQPHPMSGPCQAHYQAGTTSCSDNPGPGAHGHDPGNNTLLDLSNRWGNRHWGFYINNLTGYFSQHLTDLFNVKILSLAVMMSFASS